MRPGRRWWVAVVAAGLLAGSGEPAAGQPALGREPAPELREQRAFESAAAEFGVPAPLLMAVSHELTRWEDHHGEQSRAGGYGPMHLTDLDPAQLRANNPKTSRIADAPELHTAQQAAELAGVDAQQVKTDPVANIRAGAALLADRAQRLGGRPASIGGWYSAVAQLSGSPLASGAGAFADDVYEVLGTGRARTTAAGQRLAFAAVPDAAPRRDLRGTGLAERDAAQQPECPSDVDCRFLPAAYAPTDPEDPSAGYGNYDTANRPHDVQVDSVVLHDTELSYPETIAKFQDPTQGASAHYVIRSSDGQITQMVPTKDIAWHAGSWDRNIRSIGIEHEGFSAEGGTWYTEQMYRSSARLVRFLSAKHGFPLDRQHVLGHEEVSAETAAEVGQEHHDPGPFWDWSHYMELLGSDEPRTGSAAVTITPDFRTNRPEVTDCQPQQPCRVLPPQPTNFVYLRTEPRADAPLLSSPAQHPDGSPGTTRIDDWSAKALTGRRYAVAGREGDWLAIWFGGQRAWLQDPRANTSPAGGSELVQPVRDRIQTFGRAVPQPGAYPPGVSPAELEPLPYEVPAGQSYVVGKRTAAQDYHAVYDGLGEPDNHLVIRGPEEFVQISYNHRWVYVKASDVR